MTSNKQKTTANKQSRKIGTPRVARTPDAAVADSRTVRFGAGSLPASMRK